MWMCFKPGLLNRAALVWIKNRLSQRGAGIFCRLPCAVVFWFLGEKPTVWPRFRTFSHLLFEPAGGTLVAQSLMITALPVLCCMGDSLRIPMIFFFYPISLASLFIHPSSCLSLLPFMFLLLSLHLHSPGLVHGRCCFLSLRLILCLSLLLTAFFFAAWVEGC